MDRTNANLALASALVEEFQRCGVRRAVISPGSRSTPLALALARQHGVDTTVVIDERSAGFLALGIAHASGDPVAVLCTSGSAAANLHPAVTEADESGIPLIVISADRPPELRGIGAGQTIDQIKLYGSAVRWFCEVGTHAADDSGLLHFRSVAGRAYARAAGDPRPGPVHLNVAWREPLAPVEAPESITASDGLALDGAGEGPLLRHRPGAAVPDAASLEEIGATVSGRRALILCGRQTDPDLAPLVSALAAALECPILAEPTSQLRLGAHDRSRVIAGYDAIAREEPAELAPEIVLRFGEAPTSKALRSWLGSREGLQQIAIDPSYGSNEPLKRATEMLRWDARATATGLIEHVSAADRSLLEAWRGADTAVQQALDEALGAEAVLSEPGVQRALPAALGEAEPTIVYAASSMPVRDQEEFMPGAATPARFLANRGTNGIDGFVSSAIGAAIGSGQRTVAVLGDLCLQHDVNGLLSLNEASTPVHLIVINNGGGGIFHFLPQADLLGSDEFETLFGTPAGVEPANLARAFGVDHVAVETAEDLTAALAGPSGLLEVRTNRRANRELHDELRAEARQAVWGALGRS